MAQIKSVVRVDDKVLVFDENAEQIPEYQGQYQEVRGKILRDAPPNAALRCITAANKLEAVPREEW